tara:strand:+ start:407 stop:1012 length:606 start_codon:yes stop_codon:yes gene_type:complete
MTGEVSALQRHSENFASAEEQRSLGFWTYLMTDALIFALMFTTYAVMVSNTAGGPGPKELYNIANAAAETAILLISSITFGFATISMLAGKEKQLLVWLTVTFVLGAAFLFLEIKEFTDMIALRAGPARSGFLSSFFTLVGTHGAHVATGMLWILILSVQVVVKGLRPMVVSRLLRLGIFWHFLDIIWVGIFSVVYLPGVM